MQMSKQDIAYYVGFFVGAIGLGLPLRLMGIEGFILAVAAMVAGVGVGFLASRAFGGDS
ncbi:MAG: hypothetical protein AAFS10_24535 [Myxococcota bacterium]